MRQKTQSTHRQTELPELGPISTQRWKRTVPVVVAMRYASVVYWRKTWFKCWSARLPLTLQPQLHISFATGIQIQNRY